MGDHVRRLLGRHPRRRGGRRLVVKQIIRNARHIEGARRRPCHPWFIVEKVVRDERLEWRGHYNNPFRVSAATISARDLPGNFAIA
jgi:hypothetical protein